MQRKINSIGLVKTPQNKKTSAVKSNNYTLFKIVFPTFVVVNVSAQFFPNSILENRFSIPQKLRS